MATSVGADLPSDNQTRLFSLGRVSLVSRSDLGDLSPRWDSLVDSQPVPNHCLKSWWMRQAAQAEPMYLLAMDGDELLGGLALEVDRWHGTRRARTIGLSLWPAHFDLVADPAREQEVCELLEQWLRSRPPFVFDFKGVSHEARLLEMIPEDLRIDEGHGSYAIRRPDGGMTEWLETMSANRRKDVRRAFKRLEAAGCQLRVVPPAEADRALEDLRRLQHAQFGDSSVLIPVFDRFRGAVEVPLRTGEAQFFEIVGPDGRTLVLDLWIRAGWRAESFAYARSPDAPAGAGNALLAYVVDAADPSIEELDLGTHHGTWKRGWAQLHRRCVDVRGAFGVRPRLVTRTVDLAVKALRFGRRMRK